MIRRADVERMLRGACRVVAMGLFLVPSGCQLLVNGFVDELADAPVVTTPSVVLSREYVGTPSERQRAWAPVRCEFAKGTVLHVPLYFEDAFEDRGSEDGEFKWTLEDYLWTVEWPARYMLNASLFPVSVVVQPPWQIMASDGHLSEQWLGKCHDAERWEFEEEDEPVESETPASEMSDVGDDDDASASDSENTNEDGTNSAIDD